MIRFTAAASLPAVEQSLVVSVARAATCERKQHAMISCLIRSAARVLSAVAVALGLGVVAPASAAEPNLPRPDHIVLVVMENRDFSEIIGSPRAPFINELA